MCPPDLLRRTLEALRATAIPRLIVFSDGPRSPDDAGEVAQVRALLDQIDWCEATIHKRDENYGLGRSSLPGSQMLTLLLAP